MRFPIVSCALLLSAASAVLASPMFTERSAEEAIICSLVCDGEGCVPCPPPKVERSCQEICTATECFPCDGEDEKRSVKEERVDHPCPEICNEEGQCGCNYEPVV